MKLEFTSAGLRLDRDFQFLPSDINSCHDLHGRPFLANTSSRHRGSSDCSGSFQESERRSRYVTGSKPQDGTIRRSPVCGKSFEFRPGGTQNSSHKPLLSSFHDI